MRKFISFLEYLKKRRFPLILLLILISSGLFFFNIQTKNQKELIASFEQDLERDLGANIETVECYREAYGSRNEFFRYDCNYIGKDHKNIGLVQIEEKDLTPPIWIVGTGHKLDFLGFYRNSGTGHAKLIIQHGNIYGSDSEELSQWDARYQENLVKVVSNSR